jgi:hypothetical protein
LYPPFSRPSFSLVLDFELVFGSALAPLTAASLLSPFLPLLALLTLLLARLRLSPSSALPSSLPPSPPPCPAAQQSGLLLGAHSLLGRPGCGHPPLLSRGGRRGG